VGYCVCELNHNFADWQGYGLNEIEVSTDCAVYSFDDLARDLLSRDFQIQWCVIKLRSTHCRTAWRMKFRSTVPASMSFMSAIQYGQHHLLANCASGKVMVYRSPQDNEANNSNRRNYGLTHGKVML
jgi:hypothetical protein